MDGNPIFIEHMGHATRFDGKIKDLVFQDSIHKWDADNDGKYKYDSVQNYALNAHGYRSPEFKSGTPFIFGGCSYTYGVGIPEESIWGVQLAKKLGLDYANISMPGASVPWVVEQIFAYCREFGNPEYIVCAFPNFFRGVYTQNNDVLVHDGYRDYVERDVVFYALMQLDSTQLPKISKRPHVIDDVTPPELPVYHAMKSIRILEQYCEAAGINLKWAFIESSSELAAREIEAQYGFKNRVDLNRDDWVNYYKPELYGWFLKADHTDYEVSSVCACSRGERCDVFERCHEDQREVWGEDFDLASDRDLSIESAHMGVHSQIHIAEDFYRSIVEL